MSLFDRKNRDVIGDDEPKINTAQYDAVERLTKVQDTLYNLHTEIEEIKEQVDEE